MNTRYLPFLAAVVFASTLSTALAAPPAPAHGISGFQLEHKAQPQQNMPMPQENPKEAAMGGIERLGILEPLFDYCHTPVSVKAPFLKLASLMKKTAVTHHVATQQEVDSWENMGKSRTKTQWVAAKEKGINVAGSCIAVEMELKRQDPLVNDALKRLENYAKESAVEKH